MIPRLPLRNASAMALGTSASASITLARASWAFAFISCSWLRPWRGVPLPWLEQYSCRHLLGLSVERHRYSYLCQYQQCQWTESQMPYRHPTPCEYQFGDRIRIFQNRLMVLGRTDRRYNTFAYTGKDRIFSGTTHQLTDIGTYGYTGFGNQLDTVFCHGCHGRGINYFWVNGHLYGLEYIASGKVDGGCHLERQLDIGFRGGYQCVYHPFSTCPPAR